MLNRRPLLAAAALGSVAMKLRAQTDTSDWPNKPVKIIVGFPPGQSSDLAARGISAELQKAFGQPFKVENRPGIGATLAARYFQVCT